MNEALIVAIITVLGVPLSVFITWIVNRRKNISELYTNITEASQTSMEIMQTAMDRLSEELVIATQKIEALQSELNEVRHQNLLLLEENHRLHKKIADLMDTVKNMTFGSSS